MYKFADNGVVAKGCPLKRFLFYKSCEWFGWKNYTICVIQSFLIFMVLKLSKVQNGRIKNYGQYWAYWKFYKEKQNVKKDILSIVWNFLWNLQKTWKWQDQFFKHHNTKNRIILRVSNLRHFLLWLGLTIIKFIILSKKSIEL